MNLSNKSKNSITNTQLNNNISNCNRRNITTNNNQNSFIFHWNMNGFHNNLDDLKILLEEYNPFIICLNETHLSSNQNPNINNYKSYSLSGTRATNVQECGGVSILVKSNLPHKVIDMNSELQTIAIEVNYPIKCSIISTYLRPSEFLNRVDLENFFENVPKPWIWVGDFNAHHDEWFSDYINQKGGVLFEYANDEDLTLLNTNTPTRHGGCYRDAVLDLAFTSSFLQNLVDFKVHNDPTASDHSPIIISSLVTQRVEKREKLWNYSKANWDNFSRAINFKNVDMTKEIDLIDEEILKSLINAAKISIPLTSGVYRPGRNNAWWNEEFKREIKVRNKLYKKSRQLRATERDKAAFRIQRSKVKILKQELKDKAAEKACKSFAEDPTRKKIWNMIGNITGKKKSEKTINIVDTDGLVITDREIIAEKFADLFYNQMSPSMNVVQHSVDIFPNKWTQEMNLPITYAELEYSISNSKSSSPGEDQIKVDILKHFKTLHKSILLDFYNKIWKEGKIPKRWKSGVLIPIPKDSSKIESITNYRPIQLLPVISKIMEKIVARRLDFFLESNEVLSHRQFGFRKRRSVIDNLVAIESDVREALQRKNEVVMISFDIQKAYDTISKEHILTQVRNLGLEGEIVNFIKDFLCERRFKVKFGAEMSSWKYPTKGVPQGSGLSVILFNMAMNTIDKFIKDTNFYLYADDLVILFEIDKPTDIDIIHSTLQNLESWSKTSGLVFSSAKTNFIIFSNKNKSKLEVNDLKIHGEEIEEVKVTRVLGILFDQKLTFHQHIDNLIKNTKTDINLLKWLAGGKFNLHRDTLMTVLNAKLRSRIEFGAHVFNNIGKVKKDKLQCIYNNGLRSCLRAFRTSPVISLRSEAGELELEKRREIIICRKATQILAQFNHPLTSKLTNELERSYEEDIEEMRKPSFVQIAVKLLNKLKVSNIVQTKNNFVLPFWKPKNIFFFSFLHDANRNDLPNETWRMKSNEVINKYRSNAYEILYTDGSLSENRTAWAVTSETETLEGNRLSNISSVMSAEIVAIVRAVQIAKDHQKIAIFTDSLSCIQALRKRDPKNNRVRWALESIESNCNNNRVDIIWIPSHKGIKGNELADKAAKNFSKKPIRTAKQHEDDIKKRIKSWIMEEEEKKWNAITNNHLKKYKLKFNKEFMPKNLNRMEMKVWTRLRLGHTKYTHEHIFHNLYSKKCSCGNFEIDVKHILFECKNTEVVRKKYDINETSLINPSKIKIVCEFLREINLINLL